MRLGPPPRMITLLPVAGIGLCTPAAAIAVALVAGIHVGRGRGELGRAGVDALVDRRDAGLRRARSNIGLLLSPAELGQARVGEAELLQRAAGRRRPVGRPLGAHLLPRHRRSRLISRRNQGSYLQMAWISSTAMPEAQGLGDDQGRRSGVGLARRARRVLRIVAAGDVDLVEAGEAGLHRAQRLLHGLSAKVRPTDMASPTDFIERGQRASAPGNFSKVKRGILVTT